MEKKHYTDIEDWLISVIVFNPTYCNKVNIAIFDNPANREIYLFTKRHYAEKGTLPLYADILEEFSHNLLGDIVPLNELDKVYERSSLIKNKNNNEIEKEFSMSVEYLQKRKRVKEKLLKIDEAKELIKTGKENEGIEILKNITFHNNKATHDTFGLMLKALYENNTFLSGLKVIDINLGGFLKKNLMTILGDSGTMKTMVSLDICHKILMKNKKFKCAYFEKETSVDDISRREISRLLNRDRSEIIKMSSIDDSSQKFKYMHDLSDEINKKQEKRSDEEVDVINRLKIFSPDQFSDVKDMYEIIDDGNYDIWVLDFATMIEPKKGEIDDASLRKEFKLMKAMINDTNTFGIVLSQLKTSINMQVRSNKVPTLGDMEWGKYLRQFSAWIFSIFYPYHEHPDSVLIDKDWYFLISQKVREGPRVTLNLLADYEHCIFNEPDIIKNKRMTEYLKGYIRSKIV